MSLLTKEQQTIFGNIRQAEANAFYNPEPGCGNQFMNARVAVIELLAIVDDLQARAPKQYTEQELTEILQKDYPQYWQGLSGDYFQKGFREAAQRFGALKAEP